MSRVPMITDAEERELIALSEQDGWISVGDIEERRAYWQKIAQETLNPERQRISISIPKRDLRRLKARAAEEGIPYQTLINSLIHKYVEGR